MFIDSIEKLNKYKYKVKTETSVFYVYQSDLRKYSIKEGNSYSESKEKSFRYIKQSRLFRSGFEKKTVFEKLFTGCH